VDITHHFSIVDMNSHELLMLLQYHIILQKGLPRVLSQRQITNVQIHIKNHH
jgi:hypothetical protein